MAAALSDFQLASELGPSPSEADQLRELCSKQAEQIEQLQDLATEPQQAEKQPQGTVMQPAEKQALIEILSDLGEKVKALELLTAKQARQIEDLQKEVKASGQEIYDVHEMARTIISDACKRISAIENRNKPKETDVNIDHINVLAQELFIRAKAGQRGVTYAEAAKILKLNKARVCQLRGLIAADSRFNISWHPKKKNTKVICLKIYNSK
jgi:hypothetical protein